MFVSGIISRISRNAMDQCRVLVSSRPQKSSIFAYYFQSLRDTSNKMTSIHYSILNGSQRCGFSSSASPRPAEKEEFLKYGGMENVRDRITQEAENPKKFAVRGNFIDAFLLKMKKKRDLINNKKIWSRRSCILPEFVDRSVRIYNGKMFVRCKITEGKVGHKFGEFASTRKRRPMKAKSNTPPAKKGKK